MVTNFGENIVSDVLLLVDFIGKKVAEILADFSRPQLSNILAAEKNIIVMFNSIFYKMLNT